jgi:hypothetical protein
MKLTSANKILELQIIRNNLLNWPLCPVLLVGKQNRLATSCVRRGMSSSVKVPTLASLLNLVESLAVSIHKSAHAMQSARKLTCPVKWIEYSQKRKGITLCGCRDRAKYELPDATRGARLSHLCYRIDWKRECRAAGSYGLPSRSIKRRSAQTFFALCVSCVVAQGTVPS